jgi:hypothetical protein
MISRVKSALIEIGIMRTSCFVCTRLRGESQKVERANASKFCTLRTNMTVADQAEARSPRSRLCMLHTDSTKQKF